MADINKVSWVNGQIADQISVFDRGLAFGDGVFETMFLHRGCLPLFELHKSRLLASLEHLGIQLNEQTLNDDIQLALNYVEQQNSSESWRLKLIITRGNSDSGYTPNPYSHANRVMHLLPYDNGLVRLMQEQGVKTTTCQWRLSHQPSLAGIKHLNRLDQIKARLELSDTEYFEGLMLSQDGLYTDGTMSNIFAVAPDGELITPALNNAGVSGVMRRLIMETLAEKINKSCYEAEIHRMNEFSEVFICNAMLGIIPVLSVDQNFYPIGPITRQLQRQLSLYIRQAVQQDQE